MLRLLFCLILTAWISIDRVAAADTRRVALVIGQNAYDNGLSTLANPANDARRMAALLAANGFDVVSCDGKTPGCFDLDRRGMLKALARLQSAAIDADMALVFYAGHGLASGGANILAPTDAAVDCANWTISRGVLVDQFIAATELARNKLIIIDACRNDALTQVCGQPLATKLAGFQRIEAGHRRGFLLVTSTQFGQEAMDGPPGTHSPFASALFATLEKHPRVYFEQIFNEAADATFTAVQKRFQFTQIPGRVVGGAAPPDCLAGKSCIGDVRMAALSDQVATLERENARAQVDAGIIRTLIAEEEAVRGQPYTAEARQRRVEALGQVLRNSARSEDPNRREGLAKLEAGDRNGALAAFERALAADEAAAAEIEVQAARRRKAAAESARDLATLVRGTNVARAVDLLQRAVKNDPTDAQTWDDLARAATDAGDTATAMAAFQQAAKVARDANDPRRRYWATLGMGDIASAQGRLPSARRFYETAGAMADRLAKADPNNAGWQRDLSVSYEKVGNILVAQGNLPGALASFKDSLAIADRLAKADPNNAGWQRDL